MKSICAGETILGQVMMWVLIIAVIGLVFHGLHGKEQNMQPSFTNCTPGTCNLVNFTVFKPSDWT
jgi:hypothetical protein